MSASVKQEAGLLQVVLQNVGLDVLDLAKLCLSSAGLRSRILMVMGDKKALAGLVKQALGSERARTSSLHQKRAFALQWLRKQLDHKTAAAALEELTTVTLVNTPNVPLTIATVLVRDWGVRPSCEQLVQAARNAVPGVEAWVKAVLAVQLNSFPMWMQALSEVRSITEFLSRVSSISLSHISQLSYTTRM